MLVQRIETALDAVAVGKPTPSVGVKDYVLLVVKAVVNEIGVSALIDSRASKSVVNNLLCYPQDLHFVGANATLELANGETIVSIGITRRVLVCIGSIPCWPMIEGVQLIFGKDWVDIISHLVD